MEEGAKEGVEQVAAVQVGEGRVKEGAVEEMRGAVADLMVVASRVAGTTAAAPTEDATVAALAAPEDPLADRCILAGEAEAWSATVAAAMDVGAPAAEATAMGVVAAMAQGEVAMWAILSIGLFNSIMWSNIFTLAIEGLGKYTSQGSSVLIMAILGAAVVPLLQGLVADLLGIHMSFIIPLFCYIYVLYYGFYGHKINKITLNTNLNK